MSEEWFEVAFDRLYPVLYRHRDGEEARRAAATYAPRLLPGSTLDLACGAGRHMAAFGAAGLDMVGLDLSPFLLARAGSDPALAGRLVRGDMRALPFRDGAFAGVINMFTSFGYFETDGENAAVLAEVARVLRTGGRFLFDFLNARRVLDAPLEQTVREQGGYVIEEDRRLVDGDRFLVKRVRVRHDAGETLEYDERVRLYQPAELGAMLAAAGLDVVEQFGGYDAAGFDSSHDDRLVSLCERRFSVKEGS